MSKQYARKALQIDKELGTEFHKFCLDNDISVKELTEKLIINFLRKEVKPHETLHPQTP